MSNNVSKNCAYCDEEIEYEDYYFHCHLNEEDYCSEDCCIDDLRNKDLVAVGEDGRYYCNCEFYEYDDLIKEIGEWE